MKDGRSGNNVADYYFQSGDDCHLDMANGFKFDDGSYGYIITENYPFIMPGYMVKTISEICYL